MSRWQGEVRLHCERHGTLDTDAHPDAQVPMQAVHQALREFSVSFAGPGCSGRAACKGRGFIWSANGDGTFEVAHE